MKPTLTQSPVVFTEQPHGYHLHGQRMSGITSLIHQVLGVGCYPDATDYVKNFCIPRAAEYGTAVHHAIEAYDRLGLKVTSHPKSDRYAVGTGKTWEVADELESYIRNRQGYETVANEYTVSDGVRYASNIDNVWLKTDTQGIWLVDTKTNNLRLYPGGETALMEYLSWQLSVYAYLFERQNPTLKVEGLACNWLRHADSRFWVIDRKDDSAIERLLSVEWIYTDNGFVYDGEGVRRELLGEALTAPEPQLQLMTKDAIDLICRVTHEAEEAKRILDEMKTALRNAMELHGVKAWDSGVFKATIAADSTTETFDTARFKKEQPELYKAYIKQSTRKGGFTIKLKD